FDVLVNTHNRDIASVAGDIDRRLVGLRPQIDKEAQGLENQLTTLTAKPGASKLAASQLESELHGLKSLRWELGGEYERMNRSFHDLANGLVLAAILVYLLMVPLFRSYLGPFIIMFTVPLGLIGVLITLFVTHTTLNVQSEMGVIFLVGIVVSNG